MKKGYLVFILFFFCFNINSNTLEDFQKVTSNQSYRLFLNKEHYKLYLEQKWLECFQLNGIPSIFDFVIQNQKLTIRIGGYQTVYYLENPQVQVKNNHWLIEGQAMWESTKMIKENNQKDKLKKIQLQMDNRGNGYLQVDNQEKNYFIHVVNRSAFEIAFMDKVSEGLLNYLLDHYSEYKTTGFTWKQPGTITINGLEQAFQPYFLWDNEKSKIDPDYYIIEYGYGQKMVIKVDENQKLITVINIKVEKAFNMYFFSQ